MSADHRSLAAGIAYTLGAWLLFTSTTLVSRFAMEDVSVVTVLLFQNLICLVTVLPGVHKQGWSSLRTNRFGLLVFCSLISLIGMALCFLAVQKVSLVDTMLLNTTAPLWIPFVLLIWRKIPINHYFWPGLISGFLGILLILQPGRDIFQGGSLLALGAGIALSLNMVSTRLLSKTESTPTLMFYYCLITFLTCLPLSIYEWKQPGLIAAASIFGSGVFFALGQWAFVRAFYYAKASQLGPFSYSSVVYSVLFDWALYNQVPGLLAWIGIVFVCAGGIWAIRWGHSLD